MERSLKSPFCTDSLKEAILQILVQFSEISSRNEFKLQFTSAAAAPTTADSYHLKKNLNAKQSASLTKMEVSLVMAIESD